MVTHDQAEAMTLADRIVVMNDRRIQQVGTPMEIYARPANAFVARFVGSPAMTLAVGTIGPASDAFARVRLGDGTVVPTHVALTGAAPGQRVQLGLRPEQVAIADPGSGTDARAILVERLGDRTFVYAELSDGQEVIAQDTGNSRVRIGDRIGLRIDGTAAAIFTADGTAHHADRAA